MFHNRVSLDGVASFGKLSGASCYASSSDCNSPIFYFHAQWLCVFYTQEPFQSWQKLHFFCLVYAAVT
jgi:hypothetical protein